MRRESQRPSASHFLLVPTPQILSSPCWELTLVSWLLGVEGWGSASGRLWPEEGDIGPPLPFLLASCFNAVGLCRPPWPLSASTAISRPCERSSCPLPLDLGGYRSEEPDQPLLTLPTPLKTAPPGKPLSLPSVACWDPE